MKLVERDMKVFEELYRWRYLQGKHVRYFAEFSSQRTADRRLKLLREAGYVDKVKVLYGVSSLYTLTSRGRKLLDVSTKEDKIRIEQIMHNITMLDSVVYFMKKYNVHLSNIITEKQLHSAQGFDFLTVSTL